MTAEQDRPKEPFSGIRPSIHNEYSKLQQVLVVPTPGVITKFFDKKLGPVNPIDAISFNSFESDAIIELSGAAERHSNLLRTLGDLGVELVYSHVTPIKEGHTPLFTRDVGVVIDDKVVPSRLRYPYRAVEVQGLLDVVDPRAIVHSDRDYMIEGGDVAMLGPELVLVGIGPRTNTEGLALLIVLDASPIRDIFLKSERRLHFLQNFDTQ